MKKIKYAIIALLLFTSNNLCAQNDMSDKTWAETIEIINNNKSEFKGAVFTSSKEFIFNLDENTLKITYLLDNSHSTVSCNIKTLDKVFNENEHIFLDFVTEKCVRKNYNKKFKKGVNQTPENTLEVDFIDFFVEKEHNKRSKLVIDAFKHLLTLKDSQ